ncbi:PREDICTED: E3 ubiquitin-protein ligase SHPRH [Nicrophorus vespilloides]|uniref:E3 ubiquitin-protein ligase SHPRH n=1 Tax=Nicrophorus vespilloides TaxID=110193 RepID=A0ABM1N904_NICVS|nr:PREDICTED: E3 ubiquitin-protein ligase SHPRH [Nicrophorus vespilloides]
MFSNSQIIVKVKKAKKARSKKTQNPKSYAINSPTDDMQKYCLGDFHLGITDTVLPAEWKTCTFQIESLDTVDYLILRFDKGVETYAIDLQADAPLIISIPQTKAFSVRFIQQERDIKIELYLKQLSTNFNGRFSNKIKDIFQILFNIHEVNQCDNAVTTENLRSFYKKIHLKQKCSKIPQYEVQSVHLKPVLRQYQEQAVMWMVHREKHVNNEETIHPSYLSILLKSGESIYYNKFNGYVLLEQPVCKPLSNSGILADEMGLGKTVEVLACILAHPKEPYSASKSDVKIYRGKKRISRVEKDDEVCEKRQKLEDLYMSGKSANRAALESWYDLELKSMTARKKEKVEVVTCVCGGSGDKKGCVKCVDCLKMQHKKCMGFNADVNEIYRCPQCWKQQPLLNAKGTLIVCPRNLKDQWIKEIKKHVESCLTVFIYNGSSELPVYPTDLLNYDIVLTTYNVLQNDLKLSEVSESKPLRNAAKYAAPGSPIILLNWWRLCLDEAQIVESSTIMVSEMAQKISSAYRWAVTGTPISKGISDLHGLISYLQLEPFCNFETWTNILYKPYKEGCDEPLIEFIAKVLWRTQKEDVLDQINIPEQKTITHMLEFSDVERYFYDREHEMSSAEFLKKLANYDLQLPLKSLQKHELKKLVAPLLSLRQACAHHNAVKGRYLVTRKKVNSVEELLDALIAKNITESEENLRVIVSSLNGLAGLYLLLSNPPQALVEYRKVLQYSNEYEADASDFQLTVDNLQLIHTFHNLADTLKTHPHLEKLPGDELLVSKCEKLQWKYVNRFEKQTSKICSDISNYINEIEELNEDVDLTATELWSTVLLNYLTENSLWNEVLSKIVTYLDNNSYKSITVTDYSSVLDLISSWIDDVSYLHDEVSVSLFKLFYIEEGSVAVNEALVQAAADCHLRPVKLKKGETKSKCPICNINVDLVKFERKLYDMAQKKSVPYTTEEEANTGSWKPTAEEHIFRLLYNYAKTNNLDEEIIKDAKSMFKLLALFKKNFKEMRKFMLYFQSQVSALDEVAMCKQRLQIKLRDEESPKENRVISSLSYEIKNRLEHVNQLDEFELDFQRVSLEGEYRQYTASLEKCLGTNKYLKTLHQRQSTGQNLDACPICKDQLETKWNILPCGHSYCLECMQVILGRNISKFIQCSVCRQKLSINDINFVEINKNKTEDDDGKIKGNCSSKIEAVVRLIMKLKKEEPDVKVLVFSNWSVILGVLSDVLSLNKVSSVILSTANHQKTIDKFKNPEKEVTALLLQISLGAKGLNLIEAKHVIFVDPVLDPANELQAIGRIHRIGQTKSTFVHHFLIKNTIEKKIKESTSANAEDWDANKVTLLQLKQLFETSSPTEAITISD